VKLRELSATRLAPERGGRTGVAIGLRFRGSLSGEGGEIPTRSSGPRHGHVFAGEQYQGNQPGIKARWERERRGHGGQRHGAEIGRNARARRGSAADSEP